MTAKQLASCVRAFFQGRSILLAPGPATDPERWATEISEVGGRILGEFTLPIKGGTRSHRASWPRLLHSTRGLNTIEAIHEYERELGNPDSKACDFLRHCDPAREAIVLTSSTMTTTSVDGRRCIGQREAKWLAAEDKTTLDDVCRELNIPYLPGRVVDVSDLELTDIDVDGSEEQGSVWSGDSYGGLSGGGSHVRWVMTLPQKRAAIEFFRVQCKRVRIVAFQEGLPSSIHGIIVGDKVAVFRPVEQVIARNAQTGRFNYLGTGTFWNPEPVVRFQMQNIARRVGGWLRDKWNVRGTFNIDGIATDTNFWPTELNVRYADGMWTLAQSTRVVSLHLVDVLARLPDCKLELDDVTVAQVVADIDRDPQAIIWLSIERARVPQSIVGLYVDDHQCRIQPRIEQSNVTVRFSHSDSMAFGEFNFGPGAIRRGEIVSSLVNRIIRALDFEWGLGLNDVQVATVK